MEFVVDAAATAASSADVGLDGACYGIYIYIKLCPCIDSHLVDPHTGFIIKFQSQTIVVRPCHNNANKLPDAWQN